MANWGVGSFFGEEALVFQGTVNFIRGNLVKAEFIFFRTVQALIVAPGGLKQIESAHYVGFDKIRGTVDRAVYMGFSGQVNDAVRLVLGKYARQFLSIPEIGLDEVMPGGTVKLRDGLDIGRIS